MADEFVDVLIVGAGLSGIGAACHLQRLCPERSVAIVEARQSLGGTWDLFRYPGVRSDSDMFTLGYSFRPWTGEKAIADGPAILQYLRDTAREHGIDRQIRYGHRVRRAAWSSAEAHWRVEVERDGGEVIRLKAAFLLMCGGYYDYDQGHMPAFEGRERFRGRIVHPQQWSDDVDYAGKRVVVIGSGATAVTLVPELAKQAAHVTMLQRSPTYMISRPSVDRLANWLRRRTTIALAHGVARWKNLLLGMVIFGLCRRRPQRVKAGMIKLVKDQLAPGYDVETHFTPRYNPWEQRLCLVPDGDLFKAICAQRVSVVTDRIKRFTATGILLERRRAASRSGGQCHRFEADGAERHRDQHRRPAHRAGAARQLQGRLFGGMPNFAAVFGYTNASWTLKADLPHPPLRASPPGAPGSPCPPPPRRPSGPFFGYSPAPRPAPPGITRGRGTKTTHRSSLAADVAEASLGPGGGRAPRRAP